MNGLVYWNFCLLGNPFSFSRKYSVLVNLAHKNDCIRKGTYFPVWIQAVTMIIQWEKKQNEANILHFWRNNHTTGFPLIVFIFTHFFIYFVFLLILLISFTLLLNLCLILNCLYFDIGIQGCAYHVLVKYPGHMVYHMGRFLKFI